MEELLPILLSAKEKGLKLTLHLSEVHYFEVLSVEVPLNEYLIMVILDDD